MTQVDNQYLQCFCWAICNVYRLCCCCCRRYVVKPADLPSNRTRVPETWLTQTLAGLNTQLRAGLDDQTERTLAMQDAAEVLELMSLEHQQGDAAVADLPGRQSGSEAWRQARGETGDSQVMSVRQSTACPAIAIIMLVLLTILLYCTALCRCAHKRCQSSYSVICTALTQASC